VTVFSTQEPLTQQIIQLRKRTAQDPQKPLIIQTVHGEGYRCGD
jgi:DNA-binding response OmpR family regulator